MADCNWNTAVENIGEHAELSYDDLDDGRKPSRPLDFPAPVVHRCSRRNVRVYDPRKGEYYSVDNVLKCHSNSNLHSKHNISQSFQNMRMGMGIPKDKNGKHQIYTGSEEESSSDPDSDDSSDDIHKGGTHAYYIKRKLASSTYGPIYKGVLLKKRKIFSGEMSVMSKERKNSNLSVIREDDELQLDIPHYGSNDSESENDVWEITKTYIIIKVSSWERIRHLRGKHLEDPLKEIQAMQLLGGFHPHIVRSRTALQDDKYLYSITDYCKDGDLYSVVMNDITIGGRVKENDARHWFRQLLLSLHNLQQKGICHRNLTLENIMVHEGKCKIIDFALAIRIPYDHPHNQGGVIDVSDGSRRRLVHAQGQGGELTYMAPEVLRRNAIFDGFAVDLWAVGCILFIMLVGHMPFNLPHPSDEQFLRLAKDGMLRESLDHSGIKLTDEAIDLLQNMFWHDVRKRMTLAEIMRHSWVLGTRLPCGEGLDTKMPDRGRPQNSRKTKSKRQLFPRKCR
mmetsp:Transcript_17742/g.26888  ORF Transcript_17742/g.26888 Transcript_17742/m.26888 type:complete len:509 (-) Transcript_17742:52-1578(-)